MYIFSVSVVTFENIMQNYNLESSDYYEYIMEKIIGFDHCESNVPQYVSVEILIKGFEKLIGDYGDERPEYQLLIDALQKIGNQVLVEII